MTPLKLRPAFKDYLWGGTRLKTQFGKQSDLSIVAESWEVSCHKDGPSRVENGPLAGKTLPEALETLGRECLGAHGAALEEFPVLIKLIDAKQSLSVQVHPDDDYARRVEGEQGKNEMWLVLDCEPGAYLYYGFAKDITREEFAARIGDNTLTDVLRRVEVHPGDCLFIDAGTLHAIGPGLLIAEVQQSSNSTYRVYDFGRVGADGKPRELHIEKALDVTKLTRETRSTRPQGEREEGDGYAKTLLVRCPYFTTALMEVKTQAPLCVDEESFRALTVLDGSGTLRYPGGGMAFQKGDSFFLPAGLGACEIAGKCRVMTCEI
ncbi:type I phosphomannose isomerase catalytic subunit [Zongyangia hominis]|uniref:Phosphohexomutase n=1 Tax=Zongyangia hominis TaxID=2763677 RepID=A0A926ECI3_9FIRM|nr:type I phosphomannose isomerase catalytic subunit [Zongyangia hominis]MBC8571387.1 class I mannose-6-phosphate isomerase [Zongyangia hominis]